MEAHKTLLAAWKQQTRASARLQKKNFMPGVGFEPTRTKRPADLKSAPLDPSGIQAKKILLRKPEERKKKIKIVKKIKNYPWRDLNPQSSDS